MKTVKVLKFRYKASSELVLLFEDFRLMVNDAIRIALRYEERAGERVRSRFALISLAYPRLKEYGLHTKYILSACEVAYSAYKNRNRKTGPYARRAFLKLDNQAYRLDYLLLRIPTAALTFIHLTLSGSNYHLSFLADENLKRCSVTITPSHVVIAFSREVEAVERVGNVGVDVNERNVTWSDSAGRTRKEDTSEVAEIKARYREARAKIAKRTQNDRRTQRTLLAKYGRRERDRTVQVLHRASKRLVEHAASNRFGIVMERLRGIRKLYRKGNGQGRNYRGRMNSWMFCEFQKQVEYKAAWLGVPVIYVNPSGTSRRCPECGSRLVGVEGRLLRCPWCNKTGDRDVIASKNIMMACVVPQVRPST